MKRSEINKILLETEAFIQDMNFYLPPFSKWSPEEWYKKGHEYDEIRNNMLGWDITDYGHNRFNEVGLVLFTLRNGNYNNAKYEKTYAEKILISKENQICPIHFHWSKMEDIINRGGGNLIVKVWNSDNEGNICDSDVNIVIDGCMHAVRSASKIRLTPGMSITLSKGQYHSFWAEEGYGKVLIGEVSMVNDDNTDNSFFEKQGRFPKIEEDEKPIYFLCNEYPQQKD